ncbi:Sec7 domain [Trinorchestia longiramus]|nr:Sec7 domain [Trinorchestia longiramus]
MLQLSRAPVLSSATGLSSLKFSSSIDMLGSCSVCCCWCCGDCFEFHRGEVMKVSRHGCTSTTQRSSLSPPSPDVSAARRNQHDADHYRETASPYYSRSPALQRSVVGTRTENFQYENTLFGSECEELDEIKGEFFYHGYKNNYHHAHELLEREPRAPKIKRGNTQKRISQPVALRKKLSTTPSLNSSKWPLRQQPFFGQMSQRMSRRLVDSIYEDESLDSNDLSDVGSFESGDTYDEIITRGPVSQSRSRSPYSSVATPTFRATHVSRMNAYERAPPPHITQPTRSSVFRLEGLTLPRDSILVSDAYSFQQLKDEMADVTAEMETLEGGEDGKNNPKSKQMSIGRKKFNMDPKKGIEYLIEHGLLKNTPDDISKFLYNGEGLNKTAIGDYLGERHDFNQTVLDAFVALHNFTDLILVQALRQFLWSFRLPGEAQKIDRMMERFAGHYCDLNPTIFKHPDTCFVLSFAIIMLNTSLHNPAVKDKQTLEQFINMNRGIDNGDDLPRELLESLYESIKTEPFKIPEDDGNDLMHTFFNPDREGWLWKQGGRYKSWKRRWFILNDNCLYYFEFTTDKEPRGIIPLENIEVREVHDRNKPHCFELQSTSKDVIKACKTDSEGKVVEGKHMVYRMSAATHEEKEEWIKCIRQSISHNPFYDLLAKRKKNIQKNSS